MKTFVECLSGFTTSDQRRLVLSWPGAFLQPAPEDTNQVEVALGNISQSRGGRGYYVFVTILHQTLNAERLCRRNSRDKEDWPVAGCPGAAHTGAGFCSGQELSFPAPCL